MNAMFLETLDALKHLLWPTRCAACDVLLPDAHERLCGECRGSVLGAPTVEAPDGIDAAFALFRYEGAVQTLIARWKYHEDYGAQDALLAFLPSAVASICAAVPENAVIIPVPPHPRRLRERGFDPVWTFASQLHRAFEGAGLHTEFCDDVLVRTRHTPHQAGLSHDERMHNLDGAFTVADGFAAHDVILVDDVTTTGATAAACATVLRKSGVEWIGFLALAHAVA